MENLQPRWDIIHFHHIFCKYIWIFRDKGAYYIEAFVWVFDWCRIWAVLLCTVEYVELCGVTEKNTQKPLVFNRSSSNSQVFGKRSRTAWSDIPCWWASLPSVGRCNTGKRKRWTLSTKTCTAGRLWLALIYLCRVVKKEMSWRQVYGRPPRTKTDTPPVGSISRKKNHSLTGAITSVTVQPGPVRVTLQYDTYGSTLWRISGYNRHDNLKWDATKGDTLSLSFPLRLHKYIFSLPPQLYRHVCVVSLAEWASTGYGCQICLWLSPNPRSCLRN